jgi:hypothetical protein
LVGPYRPRFVLGQGSLWYLGILESNLVRGEVRVKSQGTMLLPAPVMLSPSAVYCYLHCEKLNR